MVACSRCTSYQEVYLKFLFRNVLHPAYALLIGKKFKKKKKGPINLDLTRKPSCILLIKDIPLFDVHLMKRPQKLLITVKLKTRCFPTKVYLHINLPS